MHVNLDASASRWISPQQAQTNTPKPKADATASAPASEPTDEVILSSPQKETAVQSAAPFAKMQTAVRNGDLAALLEAAKEKSSDLEINWNATVDPDGKIYGAAYVEALVSQYLEAESTIKSYYAEGHQENLSFDNPYAHLLQKYRISDSPFFQSDLLPAEREMAFRQERALLRGDHVALNDPYALAASGGALQIQDADKIARQAAQDKLDALIQARKEAAKDPSVT